MTSFTTLPISPELVTILMKLGYQEPTEIQAEAIPLIVSGEDVTIHSKTGSGKTLAFGIPLLDRISIQNRRPQVLILTPTRELAIQVRAVLYQIARYKQCNVVALYGKESMATQALQLQNRAQIVVGTPGRVLDHIESGTLILDGIQTLVLDEADALMNPDFEPVIEDIKDRLGTYVQTIVASATLDVDAPIEASALVDHYVTYNLDFMKKLTKHRVIFFANTKENVENFFHEFKFLSKSALIHGDIQQKIRTKTMQEMKRHKIQWLFASDVIGRGIDILDVDMVVNLEVPFDLETYVHRTGRTGRFETSGVALDLVNDSDKNRYQSFMEALDINAHKFDIHNLPEIHKLVEKEDKNSDLMTIHIKAGKKQKLRPADIVGSIMGLNSMTFEDIGVIHIYENTSSVEVINGCGPQVLKYLKNMPIKGKVRVVEVAQRTEDSLI